MTAFEDEMRQAAIRKHRQQYTTLTKQGGA